MITKRNLKLHAYALGFLAFSWLLLLLAVRADGRHGLDRLGPAIVFIVATAFAVLHAFVSSIAVLLMRRRPHGFVYAHAAAGLIDIALLLMTFAFNA